MDVPGQANDDLAVPMLNPGSYETVAALSRASASCRNHEFGGWERPASYPTSSLLARRTPAEAMTMALLAGRMPVQVEAVARLELVAPSSRTTLRLSLLLRMAPAGRIAGAGIWV